MAHPAFSNLFVHTETRRRTRRTAGHPASAFGGRAAEIWLAHVLAVEGEVVGDLEWETDRAQFVGRGRSVRAPAHAVTDGHALSNTVGPVLDPIVSLRRRVRVRPGKTVRVAFSTVVASSRSSVLDLADKYHDVTTFERVATLAWTQAQVQLHHLGVDPDEAHLFQTLAGSILYSDRALRGVPDVLTRQAGGVTALWAHGISGDIPIVLVEIDEADDIGIVRQLLRAHEYWRMKRLPVDLVILNDRAPSYVQDLQSLLETLLRTSQPAPGRDGQDSLGTVFILRADRVPAAQREALEGAARAAHSSRRGTLAAQVTRAARADAPPVAPPSRHAVAPVVSAARSEVPSRSRGGVLQRVRRLRGRRAGEYLIVLRPGETTPAPWINVIANETFGFIASESGSGTTWCTNSQENQLTPWSNDPVSDPPGEMFYIRDEDSGELWSPDGAPDSRERPANTWSGTGTGTRASSTTRTASRSSCCSSFRSTIPSRWRASRSRIARRSPGACRSPRTSNGSSACRAAERRPSSSRRWMRPSGAMFARNSWNRDFGAKIAFADLGGAQSAFTGDRTEFLGRNGAADRPAALGRREKLSGRVGPALDPCCALQKTVDIPAGGHATVVFLLGQAPTRERARELITRQRAADVDEQLRAVKERWDRMLDTLQVKTPDRAPRRAPQSVAALSDACLPRLGANGVLSGEWRVWIPRPAAGRDGAHRVAS